MAGEVTRAERLARLEEPLERLPGYERLKVLGGIGTLFVRTVRSAATPPFGWGREALAEMSTVYRRCAVPLALASAFFALGLAAAYFAPIVKTLGTIDRSGGGIEVGFLREICRWITLMVGAGVIGSAITADLGARKIREELDALSVLGVDHIRTLVVPRVIAFALMMPVLGVTSVLVAHGVSYLAVTILNQDIVSAAAYRDGYWSFVYSTDVLGLLVVEVVCGVFVGIVACYKGLNAGGGTEGVGRAVNECVMISFFGVWVIHTLLQFVILSLFPQVEVLRG
ncbi:MAG: hypothetical protein JWN32_503 [Solirubrobacterales bacterium]|nr:hypothetical protein [Solirubrobacterales bacterium]